ncbi:MAG: thiamine pyrophosphate-dependent enzyme [Patescibacteria group bacterium]
MKTTEELLTPVSCNWCTGCGNFGIWTAFKKAAVEKDWNNYNTALVAGIGCHGHILNFLNLTSFEGLHGRAIPVASGLKLANHKLNVFVFTGDGDCLSEGGNHFIHAARRNQNITVILHDNAVYGLTTGQTSPRSPKGYVSKSTPFGNIEEPLSPLPLALSAGATFVARAYEGDIEHLKEMIIRANAHHGFSVIQVLQPCVTFNHVYTHIFYQQNIYKLGREHNISDKSAAFAKAFEWGLNKIPVGVIYESGQPSYEELTPLLKTGTLVSRKSKKRNLDKLFDKLR